MSDLANSVSTRAMKLEILKLRPTVIREYRNYVNRNGDGWIGPCGAIAVALSRMFPVSPVRLQKIYPGASEENGFEDEDGEIEIHYAVKTSAGEIIDIGLEPGVEEPVGYDDRWENPSHRTRDGINNDDEELWTEADFNFWQR